MICIYMSSYMFYLKKLFKFALKKNICNYIVLLYIIYGLNEKEQNMNKLT